MTRIESLMVCMVTIVSWVSVVLFFFFQAEDGIRDAQESRWLGEVYKKQSISSGNYYIYEN